MSRNAWFYLGSYSISLLGNGISSVLFPLLVLARTGDILAAGILASVTAAVSVVAGLLAGVVLDRVNRRAVAIVSDLLSATSVAALPIVDALWGLNLSWFIALGILGAFGDVPGMTARETLLPRLVSLEGGKPGTLDRIVGVRESLSAALMLVGPGLGGLLVMLAGVSSTAMLFTASTSLLAALLSLALPVRVGDIHPLEETIAEPTSVRDVFADLQTGWRFLFGHRLVRAATLLSAVFVAILASLQGTILPAYFMLEGLTEFSGFAAMGIALGSMLGAGTYAAAVGKVPRRTWFVLGMVGTVLGLFALGLLAAPWLVLAAAVVIGVTSAPMSAVLGVATIEAIPEHMRGRVVGSQNALTLAAPALAAAPIAAIASRFGLTHASMGVAALMLLVALISLRDPAFQSLDTVGKNAVREG